jgi:hypothetical protein
VFEYVPRRVEGETGRFVELIWFARGRITGARERIAPTGSTVAAVVLGDPIRQAPVGEGAALLAEERFLIGPHDRPIVNEPQGETFCVGIVTTPVGWDWWPFRSLLPFGLGGRIHWLAHWESFSVRGWLCKLAVGILGIVAKNRAGP